MHEVKAAIQRKDSDALLAHGRFLEDKFGRNALSLPGTPPAAPPARRPSDVSTLSRTNPMAWVSLLFGVFGIFGHVVPVVGGLTCAVVAIVTGFIARRQIRRTGEGGGRLALAGVILGFAHIAVVLLLLVLFGTLLIALINSLVH
jgi:hypothetical protein